MHRSRICHFVIDVSDLDTGVSFWTAALDAVEEPLPEGSSHIYRHLGLPDSNIRILLQKTDDKKRATKERMHLDLETDERRSRDKAPRNTRREPLGPPARTRIRLLGHARPMGQ